MAKGIKEFLKKRGQEELQDAILDWLSDRMPDEDSAVMIEDGLVIVYSSKTSDPNINRRIASIVIGVSGDTLRMLENEVGLRGENTMYGERVMMRLFDYLLINEQECWIIDTDVLNWTLEVGGLRDTETLFKWVTELAPNLWEGTFREYFGNEDEMPVFIRIDLNDYMS